MQNKRLVLDDKNLADDYKIVLRDLRKIYQKKTIVSGQTRKNVSYEL